MVAVTGTGAHATWARPATSGGEGRSLTGTGTTSAGEARHPGVATAAPPTLAGQVRGDGGPGKARGSSSEGRVALGEDWLRSTGWMVSTA